jgi:hypothetical protein
MERKLVYCTLFERIQTIKTNLSRDHLLHKLDKYTIEIKNRLRYINHTVDLDILTILTITGQFSYSKYHIDLYYLYTIVSLIIY